MIIHQIYYDLGYGVIDNIERFKKSHMETKEFCDDNNIDYRLWSREDIEFFIKNISLEWITFYNNLRYDIQRIDFARLIIIYICGGIYMDLDITVNNPKENRLSIIELFKEPIVIVRWNDCHLPYNALIGCISYNKIIYQLIVYIITNYNSKEEMKIYNKWKGRFVFHTTGHYAIHKVLKKFTHVEYRDILYIESKGKKIGNKNTALFYDTNESVWYKPLIMRGVGERENSNDLYPPYK